MMIDRVKTWWAELQATRQWNRITHLPRARLKAYAKACWGLFWSTKVAKAYRVSDVMGQVMAIPCDVEPLWAHHGDSPLRILARWDPHAGLADKKGDACPYCLTTWADLGREFFPCPYGTWRFDAAVQYRIVENKNDETTL